MTGLVYFGARYYDPKVGRWLTPDPLGMIDGPNLYTYLNNNPVNLIDPWGMCEKDDVGFNAFGPGGYDDEYGMFRLTIGPDEPRHIPALLEMLQLLKSKSRFGKAVLFNKAYKIIGNISSDEEIPFITALRTSMSVNSAAKASIKLNIIDFEIKKIEKILSTTHPSLSAW